ncbi:putative ATP diphosphatase [Rosa chinensis]|uniref:Putative ATP diphosphatase n=1 Tax=Rosa chinensis TaxID=74649 RepID=A0A2P6QTC3_ROSCH|nr:DNA repair protein XRCC3 homolog [Rosa chinensis]XP_024195359.1 DNA repair protein XRCC3 homolog [Rosa chinensis]PRQ37428.1 putative ATP diphosphatase [Rosa chinensis]
MNPSNLLPSQNLTMGCPVLDRCLGGGIPCNSLTELVAESSCGKTQFCLQLTLFAQLPPSHGGLSASSLYLHTEFPFPFRRLRHLSHSFRSSHANLILSNPYEDVYVHAVHDAHHLLDIMPKIECFVASRKTRLPVRLIVIDSIAALFRSEFGNNPLDLKRRSFLFFEISGMLKLLARKYGLAVVVTNQVVDFMGEVEGISGMRVGNLSSLHSSGRRVCPALGLAWSHCVNSRLFLSRNEEIVGRENDGLEDDLCRQTRRRLDVVFAPHLPPSSCEFVITKQGVFGVDR